MRALNLAVLVLGLMLVGLALHGITDVDTSLRAAASHPTQAPQHDCDEDRGDPGV